MNGVQFVLVAVPSVILAVRFVEWVGDRIELHREEKERLELYRRERMRRALEK